MGRVPQRIPGKLDLPQVYNDTFRGWPVKPQNRQHPIRGSFLDPRPDPDKGAIYHDGVDVSVRDDRPEAGAPPNRTHRVFAIEGGPVHLATPMGQRGFVHAGHFGYGHIDPVVSTGETVFPGQHIGWTCAGDWHVHLSEFVFTTGPNISVNPLRPGGQAPSVRGHGAAGHPRDPLLHGREPGLGAAADDERRAPAAGRASACRVPRSSGVWTCASASTTRSRSSAGSSTTRSLRRRTIRSGLR